MSKILLIGGSLNQTTQMHQVAQQLADHQCFFAPLYTEGVVDWTSRLGWLDHTALGGRHHRDTLQYLRDYHLPIDLHGSANDYDLVITCTDLILPRNIQQKRLVLVQEGITTPEGWSYQLVRHVKFLPRFIANTSATGLSDAYDLFCVASEGYRKLFLRKGVRAEKIAVTGIPNFDNLRENVENTFPYRGYVLVATTPLRENFQYENRTAFLRRCVTIASRRQLIFKLHPLENVKRATHEIKKVIPGAMVYTEGDINPMIANASVVITQQSSCTYVALALGKETYSQLSLTELQELMPMQNGGDSARRIAIACQQILATPLSELQAVRRRPGNLSPVLRGLESIMKIR
jgi:hypothetical protein